MKSNGNEYRYIRGEDAALDQAFDSAAAYGKVRLGKEALFWKSGLRWYTLALSRVRRAYRRVEIVNGRLCCGGASFDIQSLVLVLDDGSSREIVIGDNEIGDSLKRKAERLLRDMQEAHPELQYGKV